MDNMFDSQPGAGEEAPAAESKPEGQEHEGGETVLVNKSLCPDCKPGDVLMVKVAKVHDEEMELEYVGKEGEEKEEEESPPEGGEGAGEEAPQASAYAGMME